MKIKKVFLVLIFTLMMILMLTTKSNASLYLNELDFDAQINSDGSMDVTETWNIRVSDTNTLYKTFSLDESKYTGIQNVTVSENGRNFTKTNNWAYHLTKDYYFGGINNDGNFEIAWGVGLDDSSATKTYKISYTVVDAISKYNDCAELYWQFLGSSFEINANTIKGTIKLPEKASSKDDIRVWGHVKTLNGEIYATDLDKVEFTLDNYSGGNYVEVRIAMPPEIVGNIARTYNTYELTNIINEETEWAEQANRERELAQQTENAIAAVVVVIAIIVSILLIKQAIKNKKILKETKKMVPTQELEYFREIPSKDSNPADAVFLYNDGREISMNEFGNVFSATLLNLNLKGYFKIRVEKNEKGKEIITIAKTEKDLSTLEYEELKIAKFVEGAMGGRGEVTIKALQKYIGNHTSTVTTLMQDTAKETKNKNKNLGKYDEETADKKNKYTGITVLYLTIIPFLFVALAIEPISTLVVMALLLLNAIILIRINKRISKLTQKGFDEREKWKGLKKYMQDFSLLNEKEVPALAVWEEYLVYATAFRIAARVIKQLKLVYPEIEQTGNFDTASYIYLMSHTDFNSSFNNAINSSFTSAMSSGSGAGGGFSGGGGGGRRRRPEAAEDKTKAVHFKKYTAF